jgi:hypothetical protein
MDATAHRIIKAARDTLVDGLDFLTIVSATATAKERAEATGHGLNVEQFELLAKITDDLYALMVDDPNPPECSLRDGADPAGRRPATSFLLRRLPPGRLPRADRGPRRA